MPTLISDRLYLSLDDLIAANISEAAAWNYVRRGRQSDKSWQNIPDPEDQRRILIDYDTIPANTKAKLQPRQVYLEAANASTLRKVLRVQANDLAYYSNLPETHSKAGSYARLAAWCDLLGPLTSSGAKKLGYNSLIELYEAALPVINNECREVATISCYKSLIRKAKPFKDLLKAQNTDRSSALNSLINRRNQNRSGYKLGQDQQDLLIHLYSNPAPKLNYMQVYIAYMNKAIELVKLGAWPHKALVSESTVKDFLYRPDIRQLCEVKRHGYGETRSQYDHIIKRKAASFANAKWVIDGTPWHRYYLVDGSAYARLNVFVVLDEHSWCVIGFCVSFSENSEQVIRALHSACLRTGYAPHQLQYDNSAAINSYRSQQVIEKLTRYNVSTQVGNARAKVIEPFFKHFNERVLKFEAGYTGSPFMSKRLDGHANKEEIARQIKQGQIVDKEQAIADLYAEFNLWNSLPFRGEHSPLELYRSSIAESHDRQRPFTQPMQVDAFWEMPGKMAKIKVMDGGKQRTLQQFEPTLYTFNNWGLRIERQGQRHDFDVEDVAFWRQHIGKKFAVKYDPEAMDKVYLYHPDGQPLNHNGAMAFLETKTVLHSALADHQPGEAKRISELNKLRKLHRESIETDYKATIERTKQAGSYMEINAENVYGKEAINRAKSLRWEAALLEQGPAALSEPTEPPTITSKDRWQL